MSRFGDFCTYDRRRTHKPIALPLAAHARTRGNDVWNNSRGSVNIHCRIIANWHVLSCKEEPLENNWVLAPLDHWKGYNSNNCIYEML